MKIAAISDDGTTISQHFGRAPFYVVVTEALVQGLPVVEYSQNRVAHEIERLWQIVSKHLT